MTPSAYTVRYVVFVSFYFGVSFILFIIVKNNDLRIFVPHVNNTNLKYVQKIAQNTNLKSRFGDICRKYNVSTPLTKRNFLYNERHKVLYCWLRKVASTSFTKMFSDMKGRHVTGHFDKEIHFLMPKTQNVLHKAINDRHVFKFIVVRHPFERLVSSYRNRIEDNSKYTAQAWIFAKQIFQLTRPHLMKGNSTIGNTIHQIYDKQKRLKIIPTFAEFTKWLLLQNPTKDDPHWATFANHCSLCEIEYSHTFYMKNNKISDLGMLFSKTVENSNVDLSHLEVTGNGPTNFSQACQYFKELSQKQIIGLYNRYKIDFEMFQYDHKQYLQCAFDYK